MNDTFYNLPPEKRAAIIEACQDEFIAYGYENASTNRIVQNAGISKGSLFQYFNSKEDLYLFILKEAALGTLRYYKKNIHKIKGDFLNRIIRLSELGMDYYLVDKKAFQMYLTVDLNPNNTLIFKIQDDIMEESTEIIKSLISGLDTQNMRMGINETFEFIKPTFAGYKMQFFNPSRMGQDPAELKKEFMEGIQKLAKFLRFAIYKEK